jgi:hypothetical protein
VGQAQQFTAAAVAVQLEMVPMGLLGKALQVELEHLTLLLVRASLTPLVVEAVMLDSKTHLKTQGVGAVQAAVVARALLYLDTQDLHKKHKAAP